MKRREDPKLSMLHDILCESLSVEECGAHDETCIWDCYPEDRQDGEQGFTDRHFVRVSSMEGKYVEPPPDFDNGAQHETFEDCMSSGRLIERDDCGVEYEDTMDQDLLRQFCERNHEFAEATVEGAATDPVIDDVNDNSTDIRRRGVIGDDGRLEIGGGFRYYHLWEKTLYFEFRGVGELAGYDGRCTASMISEYWAITSAHCVWGFGDWWGDWRLWSHVHSCSDRTDDNLFVATKAVTFKSFIDFSFTGSSEFLYWDIAWVKLHRRSDVGWFGFGYNSGFSGNLVFGKITYPEDKQDCKKYWQQCVWSGWWDDYQSSTDCESAPGATGAPIYKYKEGFGYVIYAILYGGHSEENLATRITKVKYNAIKMFL